MTLIVICFYPAGQHGLYGAVPGQPGSGKALMLTIDETSILKNPRFIQEYRLKVTPHS